MRLIEKALAEVVTFLGMAVTKQKVEVIPEQSLFQWTIENASGQKVVGAVGNFDGTDDYVKNRSKAEIVCAIAIASHPLGTMINSVIAAISRNMHDDLERNNPVEVMTRAWLKGNLNRGVQKGLALTTFLGEIHLGQNIEEIYAAANKEKNARKRHGPR